MLEPTPATVKYKPRKVPLFSLGDVNPTITCTVGQKIPENIPWRKLREIIVLESWDIYKRRDTMDVGNSSVEAIKFLNLGYLSPISPPIGDDIALANMNPVVRDVTSRAVDPRSILSLNANAGLIRENAIPENKTTTRLVLNGFNTSPPVI